MKDFQRISRHGMWLRIAPDGPKKAIGNQNVRKDEPFSFQSPFLVLVVMSVFHNQNDEAP